MEIGSSKGFVYTLEAVIASTLILSVIITVIPESNTDSPSIVQERAYSGFEALDNGGHLGENPDPEDIEDKLDTYIPAGYNFSIQLDVSEKNEGYLEAPGSTEIEDRNSSRLLLWINPEDRLNITLDGTSLVEDAGSEQYLEFNPDTGGNLQVNGSGSLKYERQWTETSSTEIESENIYTTNYIWRQNQSYEASVRIWQE